jgi:hypothetical protein
VVWDDARSGPDHHIFGARMESNGQVLDPSGFQISSRSSLQTLPDVDSNGTNSLVVWQDTGVTQDIYGSRVSPGGTVLDPTGIVVASTGDAVQEPAVVARGSGYVAAWQQRFPGADIMARAVGSDGTVQGIPALVSSAADGQIDPALAWSGTDFLAAWTDHRPDGIGVNVARIGSDGSIIDGTGIPLGSGPEAFSSPSNPAIAVGSAGTTKEFLVVWEDRRTGGPTQVWGARVATDGRVLDPGGFRIFSRGTDALFDPAVTWDGTDFLVTWVEYDFGVGGVSGVFATRVAPDGTVLDPGGITLATSGAPKFGVSGAGNARGFLVAWSEGRSGTADVLARRVSPGGAVRDATPLQISKAPGSQTWPAVATNGSDFLVAWQSIDGRRGVNEVDGTPVTTDGVVTDPGGTTLLPKAGTPAAAWDGSTYLVAAGTAKEVLGQRVGAGGGLDGSGFRIAKEGDQAAAVAGPQELVAVAYVRKAPERPYGTYSRGFLRFVDEVPDTTAPATALRAGASGRVTASSGASAPSSPRGVHALAIDSNAVVVGWDPPADATRYRVFRDGALIEGRAQAVASVDSALAPGSTHTYAVSACNNSGCSPRSAPVPVTTLGPCEGVSVAPGQDIQAAIDAHAKSTTFCFRPGTYPLSTPLGPKDGDILWAAPGTVLTGHGSTAQAITGKQGIQDDVTVRGFTIQQFAGFHGAVDLGGAWVVEHNSIVENREVGLWIQSNATVRGNVLDRNGKSGLLGWGVSNVMVEGNEIAQNNTASFPVNAAGGLKILRAGDVALRGNRVYGNVGNGMHCDIDCIHVRFVGNLVADNFGAGIHYELGWAGIIRGNLVFRNDARATGLPVPYGGNIFILDSQGTEIVRNLVRADLPDTNGIGLYDRDRGSGIYGTYQVANDSIHDNGVYMHSGGENGVAGAAHSPTSKAANVRFVHNTHYVDWPGGKYFVWGAWPIRWKAWQGRGNDVTGSLLPW